jgi:hypothetical protein
MISAFSGSASGGSGELVSDTVESFRFVGVTAVAI